MKKKLMMQSVIGKLCGGKVTGAIKSVMNIKRLSLDALGYLHEGMLLPLLMEKMV